MALSELNYRSVVEAKIHSLERPMYEEILSNARSSGLDVGVNEITPSDGNCFYHCLVNQLQREVWMWKKLFQSNWFYFYMTSLGG